MTSDPQLLTVDGHAPAVADTAWAAPGVMIAGDVRLRSGANIWYNTVLRADDEYIEIGADSNVQDGCVAHTDAGFPMVLGYRVSVGHGVVLHGCRVSDETLIGMGAVLLNGVVVGAGSIIAAGSVVLEGTEVPPGSLVAGVPGKVRRSVTDEERQGTVRNAETYLRLTGLHSAAD